MNIIWQQLSNTGLAAQIIALILALYFSIKNKSIIIVLVVLLGLDLLAYAVLWCFKANALLWDKNLRRHVFYLFYTLLCVLPIYALYYAHQYFKVKTGDVARIVAAVWLVLCIIVLFKYSVRMLFSENPDNIAGQSH